MAGPGRLARAPAELTRFIGRGAERDLLAGALRDGRLVTLHGPGGAGKTRLAVEVARAAGSFPSGRARTWTGSGTRPAATAAPT